MIQVLEDRKVKSARKEYSCDSCYWIMEALSDWWDVEKLTFQEKRQVVVAKIEGWKIKVGQPYERQTQIFDGDFHTFRCRPEMHAICVKHKLYPEL